MGLSECTALFCLLFGQVCKQLEGCQEVKAVRGFYLLAETCQEKARVVGVGLGNFIINTVDDATGHGLLGDIRGLNCGNLEITEELKVTAPLGLELGLLGECSLGRSELRTVAWGLCEILISMCKSVGKWLL